MAVAASLLLILVATGVVLLLGWLALGRPAIPRRLESTAQFFDGVKIGLAIVAGLAAAVGLTVSYRKQRGEEVSALTGRYTTAADQLGHSMAAVRLAGVYAMARLADDWQAQRQTCIDVLCAYLRMPYAPSSASDGEREVRLTIIRVVRDHLRPSAAVSWSDYALDFTGVVLDGGDLDGAAFTGGAVSFDRAVFMSGDVSFAGAIFAGASVSFRAARFFGSNVNFARAEFQCGSVDWGRAEFSEGSVSFQRALFSGTSLFFKDAAFTGGDLDFSGAILSAGSINLDWVTVRSGTVGFRSSQLNGASIAFSAAKLVGGRVDFAEADFLRGVVRFYGSKFNGGSVDFDRARFQGGRIIFEKTSFSGADVSFAGASFSGGIVDLSLAGDWSKPARGLPEEAPGLRLPTCT